MKLLPIDATYRTWLTKRYEIGFNADLQERLAGINYEESLFYIKKLAVFAVAWFTVSDVDIQRFLHLHERHAASFEFQGSHHRFQVPDDPHVSTSVIALGPAAHSRPTHLW